jgi:hypothetical protein
VNWRFDPAAALEAVFEAPLAHHLDSSQSATGTAMRSAGRGTESHRAEWG